MSSVVVAYFIIGSVVLLAFLCQRMLRPTATPLSWPIAVFLCLCLWPTVVVPALSRRAS